jgi:hypothetical protein
MASPSISIFKQDRKRRREESDALLATLIAEGKHKERTDGYAKYVESVKADNERLGTHYNPHPYTNFQWKQCCLCAETITDDPYGHNPAPFREDIEEFVPCCSRCNQRLVIPTRIRLMMTKGKGEKSKLNKVIKGLDDHAKFMCESKSAPAEEIMSRFCYGLDPENADKTEWEKVCGIEVRDASHVLDAVFENHLYQWFSKFALKRNADGTDSRADGLTDIDWELFQFIEKRNKSEDATEGLSLVQFFHKNRPLWRNYMKQFGVFFMTANQSYWTHHEYACKKSLDEVRSLGVEVREDARLNAENTDKNIKGVCDFLIEKKVIDCSTHSVFMAVNSKCDMFSFALYIPKRDKFYDDMPPLCVASCGDKCVH